MYFVYVLFSEVHDRHYVGLTSNINLRLKQHNLGLNSSTKAFVPWFVVHSEIFNSRTIAREREKYLKSAAGRRWRKENINWPRGATE